MKFEGIIDARTDPDNGIHLRVTDREVLQREVVAIDFDRKVALVRKRGPDGKLLRGPKSVDVKGTSYFPLADPVEVDARGWVVLDRRDNTTITL